MIRSVRYGLRSGRGACCVNSVCYTGVHDSGLIPAGVRFFFDTVHVGLKQVGGSRWDKREGRKGGRRVSERAAAHQEQPSRKAGCQAALQPQHAAAAQPKHIQAWGTELAPERGSLGEQRVPAQRQPGRPGRHLPGPQLRHTAWHDASNSETSGSSSRQLSGRLWRQGGWQEGC